MIIRERVDGGWPIMIVTDELKLTLFKAWLETTTFSMCTGVCEYNPKVQPYKVFITIDCDVSHGREEIEDWWVEQTSGLNSDQKQVVHNLVCRAAKGIITNETWRKGTQLVEGHKFETDYNTFLGIRVVTITAFEKTITVMQVRDSKSECSVHYDDRVGVAKVTPFATHVQLQGGF